MEREANRDQDSSKAVIVGPWQVCSVTLDVSKNGMTRLRQRL
jgi:hypothetical protein